MTTPSQIKQSRPIRVLIVDDSPSIRMIFTAMLSDLPDIRVVGQAINGEEAVRMTLRLQPDLITMDIRMPIMDGLEATCQILRLRPTPIIVVANSVYAADYNISGSVVPVTMAADQEHLTPCKIFIAPGGAHLLVAPGGVLHLVSSPPVGGHRPSANLLFCSVAQAFGKNAVGIILTGMGDGGVEGLQTLGKAGAHIIVQDQDSSTVFGMPKMAIEQGTVDEILSPAGIVARLTKLHSHTLSINK